MKLEFWHFIILIIGSFILGILILILLNKYNESFRYKWLYFLLRALSFGVFITPTIFGLGHGAIPTNGLSGIIGVILGPGENYKFSWSLLMFGRSSGGAVTLLPCFIVFLINYALNLFKYKIRTSYE